MDFPHLSPNFIALFSAKSEKFIEAVNRIEMQLQIGNKFRAVALLLTVICFASRAIHTTTSDDVLSAIQKATYVCFGRVNKSKKHTNSKINAHSSKNIVLHSTGMNNRKMVLAQQWPT